MHAWEGLTRTVVNVHNRGVGRATTEVAVVSINQTPLAARVVIDPAARVAPVKRRLFGSFVEHLGRCVYTGIYEPGHPTADEDGFRGDVLALTQELGVSVVRYPGGNFVSNYRWEDGVGPRDRRPVRRDLAWRTIETNEVGTDEFIKWAGRAGVEPMLAVNLGTRGVAEALDLLEYANHPAGTALSDQRVANGAPDPHAVRLWCLGNELDGPWQTGHKTAAEYGRLAAETARAMRQADPDLELVACGSSHSSMPTFGSWEATVLEETYDVVDYISLHAYYEEHDGDPGSFLASAVDMDRFIDAVTATADHVRAKLGATKRIDLSFDEWNVWYLSRFQNDGPEPGWPRAPRLIEDRYSVTDAVVVGSLLISLLRHADRVAVACLAQLVNAIARDHDRARRRGVAADDLPPVRRDLALRQRRCLAPGDRRTELRDGAIRRGAARRRRRHPRRRRRRALRRQPLARCPSEPGRRHPAARRPDRRRGMPPTRRRRPPRQQHRGRPGPRAPARRVVATT